MTTKPIQKYFRHGGKRYRRRFSTQQAADAWEREVRAGKYQKPETSLADHIEQFTRISDRTKSAATVRSIRQILEVFLRWAETKRIRLVHQLTKPMMFDWQAWYFDNAPFYSPGSSHRRRQTNPAASWEKYRQFTGAFCNWCVNNGLLARNPIRGKEFKVSFQKKKIRAFDDEELKLIFEYVDNRDHERGSRVGSFLRVLLYSGMRVSELVNLTWNNVTLAGDFPSFILDEHTKNRDRRTVPISPLILPILRSLSQTTKFVFDRGDGAPMYSRDYYSKVMRAALARYGIKGGNVHSLRHTFCARLAQKTGDVVLIKQLAGHKSIESAQVYIDHFAPKRARQGIGELDFHV